MLEQDVYWHEQIHRVMPELEIRSYELYQQGLINDVVIVNKEWVFRFPKSGWGKELIENENRMMKFLQTQVSLPIPKPVAQANGSFVYPLIKGDAFIRETWQAANEQAKQNYADQLGNFLCDLHHIDIESFDWEPPHSYAPAKLETWLEIYDRVIKRIFPLLLPHQIDWIQSLFYLPLSQPDFFDYKPVITHGDLAPDHILCQPEKSMITGIIDFGVAGLGDPATDLGNLINYYGESLISRLKDTYPNWAYVIDRARFYAHALDIQWVLLGLESGEKYWFTSHLGSSRDIFG